MNQFRYLGSLISDDWTCIAEIKSRIVIAKSAFKKCILQMQINILSIFAQNIEQRTEEEGNYEYSLKHGVVWIGNQDINKVRKSLKEKVL